MFALEKRVHSIECFNLFYLFCIACVCVVNLWEDLWLEAFASLPLSQGETCRGGKVGGDEVGHGSMGTRQMDTNCHFWRMTSQIMVQPWVLLCVGVGSGWLNIMSRLGVSSRPGFVFPCRLHWSRPD